MVRQKAHESDICGFVRNIKFISNNHEGAHWSNVILVSDVMLVIANSESLS